MLLKNSYLNLLQKSVELEFYKRLILLDLNGKNVYTTALIEPFAL